MTQLIAAGATPPLVSSQTAASIAVLPAPTMTKWRAGFALAFEPNIGSAFGGARRTPSATRKRRVCVAGTAGLWYVASTSFLRTCT
jgi:hypothetical protein